MCVFNVADDINAALYCVCGLGDSGQRVRRHPALNVSSTAIEVARKNPTVDNMLLTSGLWRLLLEITHNVQLYHIV